MSPTYMKDTDSPIIDEVTVDDLSQRFLDIKIMQAIPEIDVPEVEIELRRAEMKVKLEKFNLDFKLDNLSGQILVFGFYTALLGLLGGLYSWIF